MWCNFPDNRPLTVDGCVSWDAEVVGCSGLSLKVLVSSLDFPKAIIIMSALPCNHIEFITLLLNLYGTVITYGGCRLPRWRFKCFVESSTDLSQRVDCSVV